MDEIVDVPMLDDERADSKTPYGPKSQAHYADPGYQKDGKARYPLDTEEHCKAAWSYINQSGNAAKYTPEQLKRIKGRIKAAGHKYGIEFSDDGRSADELADEATDQLPSEERTEEPGDQIEAPAEVDPDNVGAPQVDEPAQEVVVDALTSRAIAVLAEDRAGTFTSSLHPHAPKGSPTGGQFTKGSGGQTPAGQKTTAPAKGTGGKVTVPKGMLGYDPASNRGTGYGMKGGDPRVHHLQQLLNRLGITDMHGRRLDDDGKLGPLTTAAVKAAQRKLGLTPDGIVSPALLKAMATLKPDPKAVAAAKPAPGAAKKAAVSKARKNADDAAAKAALKAATGLGKGHRSASDGLCTRAFDFEFDGPDGDGYTLEGYAAVFGSAARIRDLQGDFDEVIHPGAFKRSLERRTPVLQFDHGKDPRIGGTPIGKFTDIAEDSRGLHVRARLFKHPDVERVREAIAERAITGMSFRFGVPKGGDKWSRRAGDVDLRDIFDTDTHEAGPVVFPAYDATSVSVRSILAGLSADEMRELVHELREAFGLAVDLQDLTGRPSARSAGGGDQGTTPSSGERVPTPSPQPNLRTTERALKALGVL